MYVCVLGSIRDSLTEQKGVGNIVGNRVESCFPSFFLSSPQGQIRITTVFAAAAAFEGIIIWIPL